VRTIETSTDIAAPRWRVWQVLTDVDRYPAWNVLQGELVRRAAVEGAEVGDRAHVAPAGAGSHVAQPHVVEHALAQRGGLSGHHGNLLSVGRNRRRGITADES
jgi:uncharacterized protein YndB with AHSA1/START domain